MKDVKVLGPGCKRCETTAAMVADEARKLGLEAKIEKVTDYAAIAGYPHLSVPAGLVEGMPVGVSFIGTAWTEAKLLAYGYAYEQASHARVAPKVPAAPAPAQ